MAATPQHAARVLGLDLAASLEDVCRMRRALARKYHPDQSSDQERATRHMARINAAVDTLTRYIQDKATAETKRRNRRAEEMRNAKRSKERAARDRAAQDRAAQERAAQERAAQNKAQAAEAKRPRQAARAAPASEPCLSHAEQAAVRFAAHAYSKCLKDIGRSAGQASVNLRILKMNTG